MAGQFWTAQFTDSEGNIYDGAKVYHYSAGTTTDKDVYIDQGKTTVDTQPSIADSRGRVWFYGDGTYHLKITDKNDIVLWDFDNVQITDATGVFTNTGLQVQDTNASHTVTFKPGSNVTANRTITFTTGDADADAAMLGVAQTWTADQTFNDSVKITLGTGGDADFYHDGTDVVLDVAVVGSGDFYVKGGRIELDDSEGIALGTGKDVTLLYDGTNTIFTLDAVGSGNLQLQSARANSSSQGDGQLVLNNTNAGAIGPVLNVYHDSSSPADSDNPFRLSIHANDDTDTVRLVNVIASNFDDVTSTTMDSHLSFVTMNAVNAGDANTTATLSSAGVWTDAPSFIELKEYESITPEDVLASLAALSVGRYRGKGRPDRDNEERHYGPTADDFYNAFKAGKNPRMKDRHGMPLWGIAAHDMAGVAMMACQALLRRVEILEARP